MYILCDLGRSTIHQVNNADTGDPMKNQTIVATFQLYNGAALVLGIRWRRNRNTHFFSFEMEIIPP